MAVFFSFHSVTAPLSWAGARYSSSRVLKMSRMTSSARTRERGNDAVHEAEELDAVVALGVLGNDVGGDFDRCGQGRGAPPFVIMPGWLRRVRSAA